MALYKHQEILLKCRWRVRITAIYVLTTEVQHPISGVWEKARRLRDFIGILWKHKREKLSIHDNMSHAPANGRRSGFSPPFLNNRGKMLKHVCVSRIAECVWFIYKVMLIIRLRTEKYTLSIRNIRQAQTAKHRNRLEVRQTHEYSRMFVTHLKIVLKNHIPNNQTFHHFVGNPATHTIMSTLMDISSCTLLSCIEKTS